MKRRAIGIFAALAMAGFGTFLLVLFVRDAEGRAVAGELRSTVLVVQEPIPAGTPVELIGDSVALEEIPAKVKTDGALEDLSELEGLLTSVELLPGEQVLEARFVEPDVLTRTRIEIPDGTLEVTLSLDPARAVGGTLFPGDEVAVFASFDPFELGGAPVGETPEGDPLVEIDGILVPADTKTPNSTHIVLEGVLVTNVQVEELPVVAESVDGAPVSRRALAPSGNLLISVALSAEDAERVIFGAEHGQLWFARQTSDIDIRDTQVLTRGRIYEGLFR
jgi:pilus assembly protein CpaB